MDFEIIDPIVNVEVIARGRGVVQAHRLNRKYGKGRWRKLKGFANVQYRHRLAKAMATPSKIMIPLAIRP